MLQSKQVRRDAEKLRVEFIVLAEDLDRYHTNCSIISAAGSGVAAVGSGAIAIGAFVMAAPVATVIAVSGGVSICAHVANYFHDKRALEKAESRLKAFQTSFRKLENIVVNTGIPFQDVKSKGTNRSVLPIISEVLTTINNTLGPFIAMPKIHVSITSIIVFLVTTVCVADLVLSLLELWSGSKAADELRRIAGALKMLIDELEQLEADEIREDEREKLKRTFQEQTEKEKKNSEKRFTTKMKREQMELAKRLKEHAKKEKIEQEKKLTEKAGKEKLELERQLQRAKEDTRELALRVSMLENALQSSGLDPESQSNLWQALRTNMRM